MRNPREAARYYLDKRTNRPGRCLQEVRTAFGIPAKYPSATVAWRNAIGRHPGDATPPYGAPVYWTGGSQGFGHIAIYVGNGKVRSSDAGGSGRMGTVPLTWIAAHWHMPYAGWAESINGVRIPGLSEARHGPSPHLLHLLHVAHAGGHLSPHEQHQVHVYVTTGKEIP